MINISLLPSNISIIYLIMNYLTVLIIYSVTRDITLKIKTLMSLKALLVYKV